MTKKEDNENKPTESVQFAEEVKTSCAAINEAHAVRQDAKKTRNVVLRASREAVRLQQLVPAKMLGLTREVLMPGVPSRDLQYYGEQGLKIFGAVIGREYTIQEAREGKINLSLWTDDYILKICRPGVAWNEIAANVAAEHNQPREYGKRAFPGSTSKPTWEKVKNGLAALSPEEKKQKAQEIYKDMEVLGIANPVEQSLQANWAKVKEALEKSGKLQVDATPILQDLEQLGALTTKTPTVQEAWDALKRSLTAIAESERKEWDKKLRAEFKASKEIREKAPNDSELELLGDQ